MTRLRDVRRGIPHEEFVRRKRREQALDRRLALLALVPWPRWSGVALLLGAFVLAAAGSATTGSLSDAWMRPVALAALLVVPEVCFAASDVHRGRTAAGRSRLRASNGVIEGPKPLLLVLTVAAVGVGTLVGVVLIGGSARDVVGTLAVAAPVVSGCAGLSIVHGQLRSRLLCTR